MNAIDRVMRIVVSETPGDHYLSHLILCRKVLREDAATSIRLARAFAHHRLTREECEGMLGDWHEAGWVAPRRRRPDVRQKYWKYPHQLGENR